MFYAYIILTYHLHVAYINLMFSLLKYSLLNGYIGS